ncbi:MAG TPA: hypothetical protein VLJ59_15815 [Mycobacteriales bacterium]|nr:hypothetical protein [Mycobacteriales bacterium]
MSADGFGRIWRWPLYSPRRFFSCLLVLAMLVALSNMIFGGGSGLPPSDLAGVGQPSPTPAPTGLPTASTTSSAELTVPPTTTTPFTPTFSPRPATRAAVAQAVAIATAFTTAWANHNRPFDVWWAEVSRYADREFAAQLKSPDVQQNVPATRVTGPATPVERSVFYASASIEVPTDAGPVVADLVSDGHAWRVTDLHPKR